MAVKESQAAVFITDEQVITGVMKVLLGFLCVADYWDLTFCVSLSLCKVGCCF